MPSDEELKRAALAGALQESAGDLPVGQSGGAEKVRRAAKPGPKIRRMEDIVPLRDLPPVEVEWIIPELLPAGTLNIFASSPGGGKSTLAYAIAGAVAGGRDFAGRPVLQRPVAVLDRENPEVKVREILSRFKIEDGGALTIWGGWAGDEAAAPGSAIVAEWARRQEPKPLIVIDSLVAFLRADENDARAVREFTHTLRRLADEGVTFLLLHHSGKGDGAKKYRGSSDIPAAMDQCWVIEKDTLGTELRGLTMAAFKTRFLTTESLTFEIVDGCFVQKSSGAGAAGDDFKRLRALLEELGSVSKNNFEEEAIGRGFGRNIARKFLHWAEGKGMLITEPGARGAHLVRLKATQGRLLPSWGSSPVELRPEEGADG